VHQSKQLGSRTAEKALKEFTAAHPRGWVVLVGLSDFDEKECSSRAIHLFRNKQKEWNVFKRVVKHLEKLYNPAAPLTHDHLQQLWTAYRNPRSALWRLRDTR
jgi:hypothetical protein